MKQIKEQVDVVELVGRSVSLKKAGASYKGLCPFHKEKTPSFNVVPSKNIFHCFGCGAGGSVIDFVMNTEKLEFIEAVEKLAHEIGLELPTETPISREERDQQSKLRTDILSANQEALKWFRKNLLKKKNPVAHEYLPKRSIGAQLSEEFELGAALDSWDALKSHLLRLGFTEHILVEAGLCVRSEKGRVYDRFRNRLIFPIKDINNKVCGFGGRQLIKEEHSPKYLNSAETVVYKKSQMLYALNIAQEAIDESGYAILCEGYMDVLMAHAYGFRQAVASLGTALTPGQAKLLKRFATKTYFLYDGDIAGQKAMLKGGLPLLETGFDTRVISLPETDDPDTFLQREGPEKLKEQLKGAPEFFDFALNASAADLDLSRMAGQAELSERMAPVLLALRNDVMRESGMMRLLKRLGGLPRQAIEKIIARKQEQQQRSEQIETRRPIGENEGAKESSESPLPTHGAPEDDMLERSLLKMVLESPEALERVRLRLQYDWIGESEIGKWLFYFFDHHGYVQTLLDDLEVSGEFPADRQVINRLLAWQTPLGSDPEKATEELLRRLQERHQLSLTRKLLQMIDESLIKGVDAEKILQAYHEEHQHRLQQSGRFMRTRTLRERREQANRDR